MTSALSAHLRFECAPDDAHGHPLLLLQGHRFKMSSEHAASDKSDDSSDSDAAPGQQPQPPSPPTVDESPLQKCMDRNKRCKCDNYQPNLFKMSTRSTSV